MQFPPLFIYSADDTFQLEHTEDPLIPLQEAAVCGQEGRFLQLFTESRPQKITKRDKSAWSLIHYAAFGGNVGIIRFLAQQGASLEQTTSRDSLSLTPLSIAAARCHFEAVHYLLQEVTLTEEIMEDAINMCMRTSQDIHKKMKLLCFLVEESCKEHNFFSEPLLSRLCDAIEGHGEKNDEYVYLYLTLQRATLLAARGHTPEVDIRSAGVVSDEFMLFFCDELQRVKLKKIKLIVTREQLQIHHIMKLKQTLLMNNHASFLSQPDERSLTKLLLHLWQSNTAFTAMSGTRWTYPVQYYKQENRSWIQITKVLPAALIPKIRDAKRDATFLEIEEKADPSQEVYDELAALGTYMASLQLDAAAANPQ